MIDPRLIQSVEALIRAHERPGHIPLIAISGSQGSGKSTLAAEAARQLDCATFSLDDVYLTRSERLDLGERVHPLFAVRGPPGTHDLNLLNRTLTHLRSAETNSLTPIPAFDKLADDRRPETDWPAFQGRPRAILLEGWCLGAMPQAPASLSPPINALERGEDQDDLWRTRINDGLGSAYARLFAGFDALLFLKAPGFDCILDWRVEQEAGLTGGPVSAARRMELARFIQSFERITRHMLAGGVAADVVADLGPDRRVHHLGPISGT